MMMTTRIWNTCPDDERMNNEVCGVEEDELASEYEYCMDETMYSEEFNEDDVVLVLTSMKFIMDLTFLYFIMDLAFLCLYLLSIQNFFAGPQCSDFLFARSLSSLMGKFFTLKN